MSKIMVLGINGVGMAGHTRGSEQNSIYAVQNIWMSYTRFFQRVIAEGRPVTAIPELAQWTLDGDIIEKPTAWFVTFPE